MTYRTLHILRSALSRHFSRPLIRQAGRESNYGRTSNKKLPCLRPLIRQAGRERLSISTVIPNTTRLRPLVRQAGRESLEPNRARSRGASLRTLMRQAGRESRTGRTFTSRTKPVSVPSYGRRVGKEVNQQAVQYTSECLRPLVRQAGRERVNPKIAAKYNLSPRIFRPFR